jgi:hypothetical protein
VGNLVFQNLNVRFDTVHFDLSSGLPVDIPNWVTMVVEICIGFALAYAIYNLQSKHSKDMGKMTERIHELTQEKAKTEQEKKAFECQRIIKHLEGIQDAEQSLKTFLTNYKVGDLAKENLRLMFGMSFDGLAKSSIRYMYDAIGQLQSMLNDNSLRQDFLDYVGAFNVIPQRILIDNFPQQEQQRGSLLKTINEQTEKIQHFIERFKKEMDPVKK